MSKNQPNNNDAVEPSDFALEAGSGASSRDSAIQYVSFDINEAGGSVSDQEAILEPLEDEIRSYWSETIRKATTVAFTHSPRQAAEYVVNKLKVKVSYDDVPEDHRDEVEQAFETRLEQKEAQLTDVFDDIVTDARDHAVEETTQSIVDWGTVL